jgi:hypothetical protein
MYEYELYEQLTIELSFDARALLLCGHGSHLHSILNGKVGSIFNKVRHVISDSKAKQNFPNYAHSRISNKSKDNVNII